MEALADTATLNIAFCTMHTYKLYTFIGIHPHILAPTECPLNAGAGLNFINANLVRKEWTIRVKTQTFHAFALQLEDPFNLMLLYCYTIESVICIVEFGLGSSPILRSECRMERRS